MKMIKNALRADFQYRQPCPIKIREQMSYLYDKYHYKAKSLKTGYQIIKLFYNVIIFKMF